MTTPTAIGKSSLLEFVQSCGIPGCEPNDDLYALPLFEWMEREGCKLLWEYVLEDVGPYEEGCSDCDDFARSAANRMRKLHRDTDARPVKSAVAFGVFVYWRRDGVKHAINAFVYSEDEALRLGFYDPQVGQIVSLTPKEISSCVKLEF